MIVTIPGGLQHVSIQKNTLLISLNDYFKLFLLIQITFPHRGLFDSFIKLSTLSACVLTQLY